jgi:glutathione S-transferase
MPVPSVSDVLNRLSLSTMAAAAINDSKTAAAETTTATTAAGKLYYSSKSCGAASFIAANHAKLRLACESVNLETHRTASGADFKTVNPKGNVPTLVLADGTLLNEGLSGLLWIADQNASAGLAPPNGTAARYGVMNTLSWIASELQPSITRLMPLTIPPDFRKLLVERAVKQLGHLDRLLADKPFLDGRDDIGVSDLIAGIVVGWSAGVGLELSTTASAYLARYRGHPVVVAARAHMATAPAFTANS